jgi:hypothetical protein
VRWEAINARGSRPHEGGFAKKRLSYPTQLEGPDYGEGEIIASS